VHQKLVAHGNGAGSRQHGIGGLRLASRLMAARELGRAGKTIHRKLSPPAPSAEKRKQIAEAAHGRAKAIGEGQAVTSLAGNYREAQGIVRETPTIQERIAGKQTRLDNLQREHANAQAEEQRAKSDGAAALTDPTLFSPLERKRAAARFGAVAERHRRRAVSLQGRIDHVQGEITGEQSSLTAAQKTVKDGERTKRRTGSVHTREQVAEHARFIETQAALPERGGVGPEGKKRAYAELAGIVGYGSRRYDELDAAGKRTAQLEIDRELARLKAAKTTAKDMASSPGGSLPRREQRKLEKSFDRTVEEQTGTGGPNAPSPRVKVSPSGSPRQSSRTERRSAGTRESSPVRDAREVAAHRRRQLGREGRR